MLYTHGGLDADENARVRNVDGDVIPGLYAAGMCTGGQFGTDTVSGSWQTNSIVFGRIAGANASKKNRRIKHCASRQNAFNSQYEGN